MTSGRSEQDHCPSLPLVFSYNAQNRKRKNMNYVQRMPNETRTPPVCAQVCVERNFLLLRVVKMDLISTFIIRNLFFEKFFQKGGDRYTLFFSIYMKGNFEKLGESKDILFSAPAPFMMKFLFFKIFSPKGGSFYPCFSPYK